MSESTLSTSPPAEESRTPAARPAAGSAGKRGPGAERVIHVLKNLALVAPLTILIWVYAEREQSATQSNISFPIEVRTTDGSRLVTLKEPADQNVTATLTGPRTVLDQFVRDLQSGGAGRPAVQIVIPSNLDKGVNSFDAAKYIADTPLFTRAGISVKDIHPSPLRVEIDDYESRLLDVRASQTFPNVQDMSFIPAKVEVRAPSRRFRDADPSTLFVIADTSKLEGLAKPGRQEIPGIPVQSAFKGEHVTVAQPTVSTSVEVKRPEADTKLESVPVWIFAARTVLDKYKIDYKTPTIPDVHLVGPPREIDLIRSGDVRVFASLDVTPDDTASPKEVHRRKLRFILPAGVTVTNDPEQYTISFTLLERTAE